MLWLHQEEHQFKSCAGLCFSHSRTPKGNSTGLSHPSGTLKAEPRIELLCSPWWIRAKLQDFLELAGPHPEGFFLKLIIMIWMDVKKMQLRI